jgi:hypothetical protein
VIELAKILALIAVLGTAVVYGTDVFCAVVQRPALAVVDDRALVAVMGDVHHHADRVYSAAWPPSQVPHCSRWPVNGPKPLRRSVWWRYGWPGLCSTRGSARRLMAMAEPSSRSVRT